MFRSRPDTRLSDLPDEVEVELSSADAPREPFNFPDEINDTIAYVNEIVAERQQTYNLLLAELRIVNTKKLFEICLEQQNEQIAADRRNTISDNLISEIVRATAGGELTEENNILFWALCMEKNAYGEYKKMINIPERPRGLSEAGEVVMWKICCEMNEYGPLKGKIEMPDKPNAMEKDIVEGAQDGRRRTLMMDGEWHQAIIHERHDGLVNSMIAELDEHTLEDGRKKGRNADSTTDRPRYSINSDSSWESFDSDAQEPTDAEDIRNSNRRSWNEGHELC